VVGSTRFKMTPTNSGTNSSIVASGRGTGGAAILHFTEPRVADEETSYRSADRERFYVVPPCVGLFYPFLSSP
jgi:hypothetical protein